MYKFFTNRCRGFSAAAGKMIANQTVHYSYSFGIVGMNAHCKQYDLRKQYALDTIRNQTARRSSLVESKNLFEKFPVEVSLLA